MAKLVCTNCGIAKSRSWWRNKYFEGIEVLCARCRWFIGRGPRIGNYEPMPKPRPGSGMMIYLSAECQDRIRLAKEAWDGNGEKLTLGKVVELAVEAAYDENGFKREKESEYVRNDQSSGL